MGKAKVSAKYFKFIERFYPQFINENIEKILYKQAF